MSNSSKETNVDNNLAINNDLNISEYKRSSLQNYSLDGRENSTSSASVQVTESFIYGNRLLLELEENGFTTPDEKAAELVKNLTKPKHICALKLLFENQLNQF